MQSATLERAVTISGRGLFTGEPCRAELRPTEGGLAFIKSGVRIPVHPDHYVESPNCSILGHEGERVVQTEHLLCALWAAGIDTAEIEVDGPELPSQDGSALPLYEKLLDGGRALLDARPKLELDGPVTVGQDFRASLELMPAPGLCIAYSFMHPELGRQDLVTVVTRLWAVDHLLPARTFITEREALALRKAGVLEHKDESAALLIRKGQPSRPLRFSDEYVRHKMLDLLGDLYAVPAEIEGNITAARSGHELNRALARQLAAML
jgi:UDP-3-O-[3-hydroxymyristoyl] N-acetylglucosamine deacetylase